MEATPAGGTSAGKHDDMQHLADKAVRNYYKSNMKQELIEVIYALKEEKEQQKFALAYLKKKDKDLEKTILQDSEQKERDKTVAADKRLHRQQV